MPVLFAMAGFAEGAAAMGMCIGYLTYFVIAVIALYGLLLPRIVTSRICTLIAVFIALGDVWMFQPWQAFGPITSDDPDYISLMKSARLLAYVWLATMAVVICAVVKVVFFPRAIYANTQTAMS